MSTITAGVRSVAGATCLAVAIVLAAAFVPDPSREGGIGIGIPVAGALPPGGGNSVNTPGTYSQISSSQVVAGDTLTWQISGFPAGVPVYVKIDDGESCPSDSPQGACVIASVQIGSDGSASGSLTVSSELSLGLHSLRFLATGPAPERLGYSHRSADFEVISAAAAAPIVAVDNAGNQIAVADSGAAAQADPGAPVVVQADGAAAVQAAGGAPVSADGAAAAPAVSAGTAGAVAGTGGGVSSAGTGSAQSMRAASSPAFSGSAAAAGSSSGGLTPYINATSASDSAAPLPWPGIVSVLMAGIVSVGMLVASVLITQGRVPGRHRRGEGEE